MEIALLVVGLGGIAAGYKKSQRNMLLAGAIVLFLAAALGDAVEGFVEGYRSADKA